MALSVVNDQRIRAAVRAYLEAQVAAALNPAAAPAVSARFSELISVVFPVSGVQDRSACMINEFAECWGRSVATLMDVARASGASPDLAQVAKVLLKGPGELI